MCRGLTLAISPLLTGTLTSDPPRNHASISIFDLPASQTVRSVGGLELCGMLLGKPEWAGMGCLCEYPLLAL